MRYKYISVLWVFLLVVGQAEHVLGQDDSPKIVGDCRVALELKPGQGCGTQGGVEGHSAFATMAVRLSGPPARSR